jgi:hypothetical protein
MVAVEWSTCLAMISCASLAGVPGAGAASGAGGSGVVCQHDRRVAVALCGNDGLDRILGQRVVRYAPAGIGLPDATASADWHLGYD